VASPQVGEKYGPDVDDALQLELDEVKEADEDDEEELLVEL
jgi:hypothetical protein